MGTALLEIIEKLLFHLILVLPKFFSSEKKRVFDLLGGGLESS